MIMVFALTRSCKLALLPGLTKSNTGLLLAPTLKSLAGTKFAGYFAFAVIMGWNTLPSNLLTPIVAGLWPTSMPMLMYEFVDVTVGVVNVAELVIPFTKALQTFDVRCQQMCVHELVEIVAPLKAFKTLSVVWYMNIVLLVSIPNVRRPCSAELSQLRKSMRQKSPEDIVIHVSIVRSVERAKFVLMRKYPAFGTRIAPGKLGGKLL